MRAFSKTAYRWAWATALIAVAGRSAVAADARTPLRITPSAPSNQESPATEPLPRIIRGPLLPPNSVGNPPRGRESVHQVTPSNPGTTSLGPLPRIIGGPSLSSSFTTIVTPGPAIGPRSPSPENGLIGSLRQIEAGVNRSGVLQAIPRSQTGGSSDLIQNLRDLERSMNGNGILQRIRAAGTTNDAPAGLIDSLHAVDHAVRTQVRPALERISNDRLPSQIHSNDAPEP